MRLLNTSTLQFSEFFDSEIPKYAILSHRWGDEEISYHDMRKGRAKRGPGLAKIEDCCTLARLRNLQWAWIDTCCIDKKSSAELSEAINSMFAWYEGAVECYAHLSDVRWEDNDIKTSLKRFETSKWFTRGWTLQELLAPQKVVFYDQNWRKIGEKSSFLAVNIETATGIKVEHQTLHAWKKPSVATKMSWASRRQTSRKEDIAYCLLGSFGVNMPLLYGEGMNAFRRLQLEIIKISNDESIFAWEADHVYSSLDYGILADSPGLFKNSGDITMIDSTYHQERPPYTMTNNGLKFHVPYESLREGWVPLNCCRDNDAGIPRAVTIKLEILGGTYFRGSCNQLDLTEKVKRKPHKEAPRMSKIYIRPYFRSSLWYG